MSDVFISYARTTAGEAHTIAQALRTLGYLVWLDDELPPHRPFSEVIEERLNAARAVVVIWSAEAVKSEWVQSEADRARAAHKLVQLTLDRVGLPMPFDRIQCADLSGWTGDPDHPAWRKVIASVAHLVHGPGPPPPGPQTVGARPAGPSSQWRTRPAWSRWWLVGAVASVALAVLGLWLARDRLFQPQVSARHRVAVLPFGVIGGGPQAQAFAKGLLDDLISALAADQVEAASRVGAAALQAPLAAPGPRRPGADLVIDGDVEGDGKTLRVRMRLEDPGAQEALWSKELSGPADKPADLQTRAAVRAASVAKWAVSPDLRSAWKDPSLMAAYLEAKDEYLNEGGGHALEIARSVVTRAPRLAAAHQLLASALIDPNAPPEDSPPGAQPEVVAESVKEAKRALALAPRSGEPWAQLALDTPLFAWNERERLFAKGLSAEPDNPFVAGDDAWFQLYDVGRNFEAIAEQKRDLPRWVPSLQCLASEFVNAGLDAQAWATITEARRLAPDYWAAPIAQFIVAAQLSRYADALALLEDPAVQRRIAPGAASIYRQALQAAASGRPADKKAAADRVTAAARDGTLLHRDALGWLAGLGDLDGAFREAGLAFTAETMSPAVGLWYGSTGGTGILFSPSAAAMRRDRRFMQLAERLGLVGYWRSTGHWPDFCFQPGFPYDCKAEAARASSNRL
jgi:TolB-like protein